MTPKRQRLLFVLLSVGCITTAVLLVMNALKSQVVYFYTPSDVAHMQLTADKEIRIGGLVELGSLVRLGDNRITFKVTDYNNTLGVAYQGLLPNLFREGQGVVAQGKMAADGHFEAKTILAKHDENYMPPEVADALKESGRWKESRPQKNIDAAEEPRK